MWERDKTEVKHRVRGSRFQFIVRTFAPAPSCSPELVPEDTDESMALVGSQVPVLTEKFPLLYLLLGSSWAKSWVVKSSRRGTLGLNDYI